MIPIKKCHRRCRSAFISVQRWIDKDMGGYLGVDERVVFGDSTSQHGQLIKDLPPSKKKYESVVQTDLIGNFIAATLSFYLLCIPISNQLILLLTVNEPIMEAKSSSTLLLLSVVAPESKEKIVNNAAQLLLMDGTKRSKRDVQAFKRPCRMVDYPSARLQGRIGNNVSFTERSQQHSMMM